MSTCISHLLLPWILLFSNITFSLSILHTIIKLLIFKCLTTSKLTTSFLHFKLLLTLIWFVTMSINRHGSRITRCIPIFIIYNRWSFICCNILLSIRVFLFKVICFMYFLYYLLIFVLYFFYFFLEIFKLLMEMGYLLCSTWVFLIIDSCWWRNICFISGPVHVTAFSKALAHLNTIIVIYTNLIYVHFIKLIIIFIIPSCILG